MRSFDEIVEYIDPRVLNKFRTRFDVTLEEATEVARETNKWLYLSARARADREAQHPKVPAVLAIHQGMVVLDEYWHVWILHTAAYGKFCADYLDGFIHHSPGSPDFKPAPQEETERQLTYICDVLGEETLSMWYEVYPDKYSAEVLAKLQRPVVFGRPCEQV